MKKVLIILWSLLAHVQAVQPEVQWSIHEPVEWIIPETENVEWKLQIKLSKPYTSLTELEIGPQDNYQNPQMYTLPSLKFGIGFNLYDGIFQIDAGRLINLKESWSETVQNNTNFNYRDLSIDRISASYLLRPFSSLRVGLKVIYYEFAVSEKWQENQFENSFENGILNQNEIINRYGNWKSNKQLFAIEVFLKLNQWSVSYTPFIEEKIKYRGNFSDLADSTLTKEGTIQLPGKYQIQYTNFWLKFTGSYFNGPLAYNYKEISSDWSALKIQPRIDMNAEIKWNSFYLKLGGMWVEALTTPGSTELFFPHVPFTEEVLDFLPMNSIGYYNTTTLENFEWKILLETLPWMGIKLEINHGW